jgi:hypothetical protein
VTAAATDLAQGLTKPSPAKLGTAGLQGTEVGSRAGAQHSSAGEHPAPAALPAPRLGCPRHGHPSLQLVLPRSCQKAPLGLTRAAGSAAPHKHFNSKSACSHARPAAHTPAERGQHCRHRRGVPRCSAGHGRGGRQRGARGSQRAAAGAPHRRKGALSLLRGGWPGCSGEKCSGCTLWACQCPIHEAGRLPLQPNVLPLEPTCNSRPHGRAPWRPRTWRGCSRQTHGILLRPCVPWPPAVGRCAAASRAQA